VRLATIRQGASSAAVRVDGERASEIDGVADVGELLADPGWRQRAEQASGATHDVASFAPVVGRPDKIVCVGLNYRNHIMETGRETPEYPTLFAKFRSSLIGAHDEIALHPKIKSLDWEAELAVVIGDASAATGPEPLAAVFGYTIVNDLSLRDFIPFPHALGLDAVVSKGFDGAAPMGPWITLAADVPDPQALGIQLSINGELMQDSSTAQMIFDVSALVAHYARVLTMAPGDVIATGTPAGVGAARRPPRFLSPGDEIEARIEGLGALTTTITASLAYEPLPTSIEVTACPK